ncbi:MAG: Diaminopimelate decarboxylase [Elusimicrobia bacterium]|nr:Diaminopimelate decarboxylase [Elusimicrobiota bacterium]
MKSEHYSYRQSDLYIEEVPVRRIAKITGTPFYAYTRAGIEGAFLSYERALAGLPHLICYSLKANSSLSIARLLSRLGGGVDIVSGGELRRALLAGFPPENIIFSGVGKTRDELEMAIQKEIRLINVESEEELKALNEVARSIRRPAAFSLRVNPDVRAGGHPHISTGTPKNKFGVYHKNIFPLYEWAKKQKYLRPVAIQSHIGSQITRVAPYRRALSVLLNLIDRLHGIGIKIEIIDLGGGLGVDYNGDSPDTPQHLADVILPSLQGRGLTLFLEPGRSMVAQSGLLITKVLYRKKAGTKEFVIVDAAMNDLARPALYDAYHEIIPVKNKGGVKIKVDIVGPVCESGDYLGKDRLMVLPHQGDLIAVMTAGAYGFSMSSQYNSRPRVPEILVNKKEWDLIRERETFEDLVKGERIPESIQ